MDDKIRYQQSEEWKEREMEDFTPKDNNSREREDRGSTAPSFGIYGECVKIKVRLVNVDYQAKSSHYQVLFEYRLPITRLIVNSSG